MLLPSSPESALWSAHMSVLLLESPTTLSENAGLLLVASVLLSALLSCTLTAVSTATSCSCVWVRAQCVVCKQACACACVACVCVGGWVGVYVMSVLLLESPTTLSEDAGLLLVASVLLSALLSCTLTAVSTATSCSCARERTCTYVTK